MRLRLRLIRTPPFRLVHPLRGRLLTAVRVGGYRAIDMVLRLLHLPALRGRPSVRQILQSSSRHLHVTPALHVVLQQGAQAQRSELRVLTLRESVRELMRANVVHETERVVPQAPQLQRAAMVSRVERQVAFPRINVTLARQPTGSAGRRDSAGPDAPPPPAARADQRAPRVPEFRSIEPFNLPPQELSRVTDHVIRQLDRRVLSYRERTGRI